MRIALGMCLRLAVPVATLALGLTGTPHPRGRGTKRDSVSSQQLGFFEPLPVNREDGRRVVLENYVSDQHGPVEFQDAWNRQKQLLHQHIHRRQHRPDADSFLPDETTVDPATCGCDHILFLEHTPIHTLGTASDERYLRTASSSSSSSTTLRNIPTIRMDRGGEVTYHGPGQLVVYPVLDLRHYRMDIHWYMRALEQAVLQACGALEDGGAKGRLSHATRQDDTTGVWIDDHKVAAMGIKCSRWITQHGLAVNVEEGCLGGFQHIVPCGLEGRKVGCLNQFLEQPITVQEFVPVMKEALEQVFGITLVE